MKIEEITLRPPVTASPARPFNRPPTDVTPGRRLADHHRRRTAHRHRHRPGPGAQGPGPKGLPPDTRIDDVMSMNVIALDASVDVRDALRAFGPHAVRDYRSSTMARSPDCSHSTT